MDNAQCPMDRFITLGFCSDEGAIGHWALGALGIVIMVELEAEGH